MINTRSRIYCFILVVFFSGCTAVRIDTTAWSHRKVVEKIELGDSKSEVLSILQPTQKYLSAKAAKLPDRYVDDGSKVEIYYMRSGRQPDGLTTDDEFTPYIFRDEILVGIGWVSLGGPNSRGQVVQPASVTNINVEQRQTKY